MSPGARGRASKTNVDGSYRYEVNVEPPTNARTLALTEAPTQDARERPGGPAATTVEGLFKLQYGKARNLASRQRLASHAGSKVCAVRRSAATGTPRVAAAGVVAGSRVAVVGGGAAKSAAKSTALCSSRRPAAFAISSWASKGAELPPSSHGTR